MSDSNAAPFSNWVEWAKEKAPKIELEKLKEHVPTEELNRFNAIQFREFKNMSFRGEVAKRGDDLFFHFFPTDHPKFNSFVDGLWLFGKDFESHMAEAFLETFKHPDKLCSDYVPELNSWVVRVSGFGNNPLWEEMADRVLIRLKAKLGE
jgi:hypothetical protein